MRLYEVGYFHCRMVHVPCEGRQGPAVGCPHRADTHTDCLSWHMACVWVGASTGQLRAVPAAPTPTAGCLYWHRMIPGRLRAGQAVPTPTAGCLFLALLIAQGGCEVFITADGSRTAFERRPGLGAFLARVAQLFEVAVFTAGSQARARTLSLLLNQESAVWTAPSCMPSCASHFLLP